MRLGFPTIFAFLFFPAVAFAADISSERISGDQSFIQILGDFKYSDIERFREVAYKRQSVGVLLDSPGGDLSAGLAIGQVIRELGMVALVPAGAACYSACAIAWLGGTQRLMTTSSEVGFHAAYREENGRKLETGMGNALVGAYFTRLGLSEKAVAYLTAKPPEDILRLTPELARDLDIKFTLLDARKSEEMRPNKAPAAPTSETVCRVADPSDTPLNVRSDADSIVGTLGNGTKVTIKATKIDAKGRSWALVAIDQDVQGWVYRRYLDCQNDYQNTPNTKTEPTSGATCKVADPTDTPLNLRDSQYRVIGSMRNGTTVTVVRNGMDNSGRAWAFVITPDGKEGWAYREYLSCFWR